MRPDWLIDPAAISGVFNGEWLRKHIASNFSNARICYYFVIYLFYDVWLLANGESEVMLGVSRLYGVKYDIRL